MKRVKPLNTMIALTSLHLGALTSVQLPKRAQVLGTHFDRAGTLWLSVASRTVVRPSSPDDETHEMRRFVALSGGARLPHDEGVLTLVGQPLEDTGATWHVFEIDSPEDAAVQLGSKRGAISVRNHQVGPVSGVSAQIGVVMGGLGSMPPGVHIQ